MTTEPADYYHECLRDLGAAKLANWPDIAAQYAGRAYHNLDHLREMLHHLCSLSDPPAPASATKDRKALALAEAARKNALFGLALIYHDIIYVAGRQDNEAKSAQRLRKLLLAAGQPERAARYTDRLIMATKTHLASADDPEEVALLIDLDLAVLARDADGYDRYAQAVRTEFRKYPGFLYRPGRKKALRHFLAKARIYQTDNFYQRYEKQARENIRRELSGL